MIVGVDVSTKKLAFAGISDNGDIVTNVEGIDDKLRGGQRLALARALAIVGFCVMEDEAEERGEAVGAVGVEIPWAPKGRSSFSLLAVAGVTLEAASAFNLDAVVMEMTTGEWKRESVGHGNATKLEVMTHALNRGLPVNHDQDLADALCIAEAMVGRYDKAVAA